MKNNKFITSIAIMSLLFFATSCQKSELKKAEEPAKTLEVKTIRDLYASAVGFPGGSESGAFVKFSFSKGAATTGDDWDVAFRSTTILVNGGTKVTTADANEPARTGKAAISIVKNSLDDVKKIPESSTFKQDAESAYAIPKGSGRGWYSYSMETHVITPIAGTILVFKTHDEKYAKLEILSFYKGAPATPAKESPDYRYYTFKYVYQPKGTEF